MDVTTIWSAVHHTVPLLIVVANKHIGQTIKQSDVDIVTIARVQDAEGIGSVDTVEGFTAALGDAPSLLREGCTVVIDAHIAKGYAVVMSKGMTER